MEIKEIKVLAGRTFNHPREDYSNLKHSIVLHATLAEGEDAEAAIKELQAKAEKLTEDHKQHMLRSIQELYELSGLQNEVHNLEDSLKRSQARLDEIRRKHPELKALPESTRPDDVAY